MVASTLFGGTATVTCDPGYTANNASATITCGLGNTTMGNWSNFTCKGNDKKFHTRVIGTAPGGILLHGI